MKFSFTFIFLMLFLTSCVSPQLASSTPTLTPTFSFEPTSTYTPVAASTIIPTQTPLTDSAVRQIIQEHYLIIQPENVNSIHQLARYARFKIQYSYLSDIVEDVVFSPNSYILAFGSGNGAGLWNIGKYLTQPSTENNPVDISHDHIYRVAFSPDGQFVVIGEKFFDVNLLHFVSLSKDNSIWNWRESSLYPKKDFEVPVKYKVSLNDGYFMRTSSAFSPDGN